MQLITQTVWQSPEQETVIETVQTSWQLPSPQESSMQCCFPDWQTVSQPATVQWVVQPADSHPAASQAEVQSSSHEPPSHAMTQVTMQVSMAHPAVAWYWQ